MINKVKKKKEFIFILTYALISLYLYFSLNINGKLLLTNDGAFHLQRLQELLINIKHGHLVTFIASRTFRHIGTASFLFYPYVFLYPIAFLQLFLKPITAIFVAYALFFFATFIIAYFCMEVYSNNADRAYLFSLIYTLCSKYFIEMTRFNGTNFLRITLYHWLS